MTLAPAALGGCLKGKWRLRSFDPFANSKTNGLEELEGFMYNQFIELTSPCELADGTIGTS